MAEAVFIQDGKSIDYTPGSDIAAGQVVVQGDLIGVAKVSIGTKQLGALAVQGIFDFTKLAGLALSVGAIVYWDDAANVVTNVAAGNKQLGKVVKAALAADTIVRVRLVQ